MPNPTRPVPLSLDCRCGCSLEAHCGHTVPQDAPPARHCLRCVVCHEYRPCPEAVATNAALLAAERTVKSLACMLVWENVPPQATLEANVNALKARIQAAERALGEMRGEREADLQRLEKLTALSRAEREAADTERDTLHTLAEQVFTSFRRRYHRFNYLDHCWDEQPLAECDACKVLTSLHAAGIGGAPGSVKFESISGYDTNFGDDRECVCGHSYYRHFDTYDKMKPIGCKYCDCLVWHAAGIGKGESL